MPPFIQYTYFMAIRKRRFLAWIFFSFCPVVGSAVEVTALHANMEKKFKMKYFKCHVQKIGPLWRRTSFDLNSWDLLLRPLINKRNLWKMEFWLMFQTLTGCWDYWREDFLDYCISWLHVSDCWQMVFLYEQTTCIFHDDWSIARKFVLLKAFG